MDGGRLLTLRQSDVMPVWSSRNERDSTDRQTERRGRRRVIWHEPFSCTSVTQRRRSFHDESIAKAIGELSVFHRQTRWEEADPSVIELD